MKTLVLIASLSLLIMLHPPAGHSAHHRHHYPVTSRLVRGNRLRLLPLRVLRTPAVAEQYRLVREVISGPLPVSPNEQ